MATQSTGAVASAMLFAPMKREIAIIAIQPSGMRIAGRVQKWSAER